MPPSNSPMYNNSSERMSGMQPTVAFVAIILVALIAFEIFNYSTTEHALQDLLGSLTFAGIPWSTILSIAFCGIDFAGIARLFTPEQGKNEPTEVWYLFGAWLLAATMNAILTWWGVSIAVVTQTNTSSAIIDPQTMASVVPVFVAIMVWVIRILIIGTLSLAIDRMVHPGVPQHTVLENAIETTIHHQQAQPSHIPSGLNSSTAFQARTGRPGSSAPRPLSAAAPKPIQQPMPEPEDEAYPEPSPRGRMETSYHSLSAKGRNRRS